MAAGGVAAPPPAVPIPLTRLILLFQHPTFFFVPSLVIWVPARAPTRAALRRHRHAPSVEAGGCRGAEGVGLMGAERGTGVGRPPRRRYPAPALPPPPTTKPPSHPRIPV